MTKKKEALRNLPKNNKKQHDADDKVAIVDRMPFRQQQQHRSLKIVDHIKNASDIPRTQTPGCSYDANEQVITVDDFPPIEETPRGINQKQRSSSKTLVKRTTTVDVSHRPNSSKDADEQETPVDFIPPNVQQQQQCQTAPSSATLNQLRNTARSEKTIKNSSTEMSTQSDAEPEMAINSSSATTLTQLPDAEPPMENVWKKPPKIRSNSTESPVIKPGKYLWVNPVQAQTTWTNENLVHSTTKNINGATFTYEAVADALVKRKLWDQIESINLANQGHKIEIEFNNRNAAVNLLLMPLTVGVISVFFREAITKLTHVSLFNIPLGYPIEKINEVMCTYGHIHSIVQLHKNIIGSSVPIGTRVVKFYHLDKPIPKHVRLGAFKVRTIYIGQEAALAKQTEKDDTNRFANTNRFADTDVGDDNQLDIAFKVTQPTRDWGAIPADEDLISWEETGNEPIGDHDYASPNKKKSKRKKDKAHSSGEDVPKTKQRVRLNSALPPITLQRKIIDESEMNYSKFVELCHFYYGTDYKDINILIAETLHNIHGPEVELNETFPAEVRKALTDERYDDVTYFRNNQVLNYERYLYIASLSSLVCEITDFPPKP